MVLRVMRLPILNWNNSRRSVRCRKTLLAQPGSFFAWLKSVVMDFSKAPLPDNEPQRLAALKEYDILDSAMDKAFDDICALSAFICAAPMSCISLVDGERQWFKSRFGVEPSETSRDIAFCSHTILSSEPHIVPDTTQDPRFAGNPLVTGDPYVRFYAGFPLVSDEGYALGALCAADRGPRALSEDQKKAMSILARQVMALIEARRISAHLAEALQKVQILQDLLPICAWCKRIRDDHGYWNKLEAYMSSRIGVDFTHSICPDCYEKVKTKSENEARPITESGV